MTSDVGVMTRPAVAGTEKEQGSRGKLLPGRIPGVDKDVSRIIYGTLFLYSLKDDDEAFELLDTVWATGCNAFDCAAIYGNGVCEERMGRWLKSRAIDRDELVLISKGGCEGQEKEWCATISDRPRVKAELERSLRRLGVSYLDMYLLHRDDPSMPVEQIVDFMDSCVTAGYIRAWGVSNWALSRLSAALEYARASGKKPPVADSPQNSLAIPSRAVWPNTSFMSVELRKDWEAVTRGSVAMLGWETLAKGFLCGKWSRADGENLSDICLADDNGAAWRDMQLRKAYCDGPLNFDRRERAERIAAEKRVSLPEVALGYVLSQSAVSFALVGTTSASHFVQNVRAAEVGSTVACMSRADLEYLESGTPRVGADAAPEAAPEAVAAEPEAEPEAKPAPKAKVGGKKFASPAVQPMAFAPITREGRKGLRRYSPLE